MSVSDPGDPLLATLCQRALSPNQSVRIHLAAHTTLLWIATTATNEQDAELQRVGRKEHWLPAWESLDKTIAAFRETPTCRWWRQVSDWPWPRKSVSEINCHNVQIRLFVFFRLLACLCPRFRSVPAVVTSANSLPTQPGL